MSISCVLTSIFSSDSYFVNIKSTSIMFICLATLLCKLISLIFFSGGGLSILSIIFAACHARITITIVYHPNVIICNSPLPRKKEVMFPPPLFINDTIPDNILPFKFCPSFPNKIVVKSGSPTASNL